MSQTTLKTALPVLAGFFVMGFCDIVGITSDYMQNTFHWSATMTGFIPSLVFVWFFLLGIPIGNLMNHWGRKNTVLISFAITIIGMFIPVVLFNSITCILAFILLGISNAILQISLNPLLKNIITNAHMLASSLNAGQVIKAISSLAGPEFVIIASSRFGEEHWYYCFPLLGLITLVIGIWMLLTSIPHEGSEKAELISFSETFSLLSDTTILLLFGCIFLIVGIDVSTNFIGSKVMTVRYMWESEDAKYAPQIYFLCRTIGALAGTYLLTKISLLRYFKINMILCTLSVLTIILIKNHSLINLVSFGGVGFFASSIFSVIISLAFSRKPNQVNVISGLMITAVAGGGVFTPIIGSAIDYSGIDAGLTVILTCTLLLLLASFRYRTISQSALQ